jgi:hypothetical protein
MSEQAQQLFKFAIDAYVEADAPLAAAVPDMDDMLDRLHAEFIEQIFESHAENRIPLQGAVQLALVARFYERIGDHAVNISRRVRYMVTGWCRTKGGQLRPLVDTPADTAAPPGDLALLLVAVALGAVGGAVNAAHRARLGRVTVEPPGPSSRHGVAA